MFYYEGLKILGLGKISCTNNNVYAGLSSVKRLLTADDSLKVATVSVSNLTPNYTTVGTTSDRYAGCNFNFTSSMLPTDFDTFYAVVPFSWYISARLGGYYCRGYDCTPYPVVNSYPITRTDLLKTLVLCMLTATFELNSGSNTFSSVMLAEGWILYIGK